MPPAADPGSGAALRAAATPTVAARGALQQIRESAHALLAQGKVDETWELLLAALEAVLVKNRELELLVAKLRRERLGPKSERLDPAQLSLLLEALIDQAGPEVAADPEADAREDADVTAGGGNLDVAGGGSSASA